MSGLRLFCIMLVCTGFSKCSGITNYENDKNLIGEDERRGVIVKEGDGINDQKHSGTKRGLWLIAQHQHPSDDYGAGDIGAGHHGSSGPGGYGYYDSGGYGITGSGYNYGSSGGGSYYKGPSFGQGYDYNGGGYNFGHGGSGFGHGGSGFGHGEGGLGHGGGGFGHSGYGDSGHEVSQEHSGYNKLALKKLLIPLAGLAVLGAVAALSSNPVLLQLGTVQSGRRKRSTTSESSRSEVYPFNPWIRPDYEFS
ncbi:glycine-rich cell wall structural protein 1.8-like [Anoplophora glabripennis]|uniref:glycine-rich cell wall structural protein 1.8-like n=1 Tax=Anoplophora glabripennis TaxID=217634 RepID=UPI0008748A7F|nr:glycine-rich cell wall structural protein 1.8-like [Anoplophora glabripennis]